MRLFLHCGNGKCIWFEVSSNRVLIGSKEPLLAGIDVQIESHVTVVQSGIIQIAKPSAFPSGGRGFHSPLKMCNRFKFIKRVMAWVLDTSFGSCGQTNPCFRTHWLKKPWRKVWMFHGRIMPEDEEKTICLNWPLCTVLESLWSPAGVPPTCN